jgi:hypothetical protein
MPQNSRALYFRLTEQHPLLLVLIAMSSLVPTPWPQKGIAAGQRSGISIVAISSFIYLFLMAIGSLRLHALRSMYVSLWNRFQYRTKSILDIPDCQVQAASSSCKRPLERYKALDMDSCERASSFAIQ